jgi:hypothetical protein
MPHSDRSGPTGASAAPGRRGGWRAVLIAAVLALGIGALPRPADADILWGVNGHPLTSYPGVAPEDQVRLLAELGLKSYRVDVTATEQMDRVAALLAEAKPRGIAILPVLIPPVNLARQDEATLYKASFDFARSFATRFGSEISVWELENELENFAIIQPCEMRDDGTQYPCEWGPAGGVGELDYVGARVRKVEAVMRGLSEGVRSVSPTALRAMGSAGWGHVGIFGRFLHDGLAWDISVWHLYGQDPEWAFKALAALGKPIWVTELNYPLGSSKEGEEKQAQGLASMMARIANLSDTYKVQAAFIYELCDEPYWAPSFEASMGLVRLDPGPGKGGWTVGARKAAFAAVKAEAAARP